LKTKSSFSVLAHAAARDITAAKSDTDDADAKDLATVLVFGFDNTEYLVKIGRIDESEFNQRRLIHENKRAQQEQPNTGDDRVAAGYFA